MINKEWTIANLVCETHGLIAEGVTKDTFAKAEIDHRNAFGCYFAMKIMAMTPKEKKETTKDTPKRKNNS